MNKNKECTVLRFQITVSYTNMFAKVHSKPAQSLSGYMGKVRCGYTIYGVCLTNKYTIGFIDMEGIDWAAEHMIFCVYHLSVS